MNENFTPARTQFGFQPGIYIQHEIHWVEHNTEKDMLHTAVLDLKEAFHKVGRFLLV